MKRFFEEHKKELANTAVLSCLLVALTGGVFYYSNTEMVVRGEVAVAETKENEVDKVGSKEKIDLLDYVKGIQDLNIQKDATDIDYLKGITYDKKIIKSISADDEKIDLKKAGTYELVYHITGLDEEKDSKAVKVTVLEEEKAQELVMAGKTVLLSKNVKKSDEKDGEVKATGEKIETADSTGAAKEPANTSSDASQTGETNSNPGNTGKNTSTAGTGSSGSTNSGQSSSSTPSAPTGGGQGTGTGTTTPQPTPQPTPEPTPQPTPEPEPEPKWVWDVEPSEEVVREPIYDYVEKCICNGCGADITGNVDAHLESQMMAGNMACSGYHSEWEKEQVGTNEYVIKHPGQGHWE